MGFAFRLRCLVSPTDPIEGLLLDRSYFVSCHGILSKWMPRFYNMLCGKSTSARLQNVAYCNLNRWKELTVWTAAFSPFYFPFSPPWVLVLFFFFSCSILLLFEIIVSAWSFFMVHFCQQMLFLKLIRARILLESYSITVEWTLLSFTQNDNDFPFEFAAGKKTAVGNVCRLCHGSPWTPSLHTWNMVVVLWGSAAEERSWAWQPYTSCVIIFGWTQEYAEKVASLTGCCCIEHSSSPENTLLTLQVCVALCFRRSLTDVSPSMHAGWQLTRLHCSPEPSLLTQRLWHACFCSKYLACLCDNLLCISAAVHQRSRSRQGPLWGVRVQFEGRGKIHFDLKCTNDL